MKGGERERRDRLEMWGEKVTFIPCITGLAEVLHILNLGVQQQLEEREAIVDR